MYRFCRLLQPLGGELISLAKTLATNLSLFPTGRRGGQRENRWHTPGRVNKPPPFPRSPEAYIIHIQKLAKETLNSLNRYRYLIRRNFRADLFSRTLHKSSKFDTNFRATCKYFAKTTFFYYTFTKYEVRKFSRG